MNPIALSHLPQRSITIWFLAKVISPVLDQGQAHPVKLLLKCILNRWDQYVYCVLDRSSDDLVSWVVVGNVLSRFRFFNYIYARRMKFVLWLHSIADFASLYFLTHWGLHWRNYCLTSKVLEQLCVHRIQTRRSVFWQDPGLLEKSSRTKPTRKYSFSQERNHGCESLFYSAFYCMMMLSEISLRFGWSITYIKILEFFIADTT